jgi:PAS domain S-box-containing protein
MQHSTNGQQTVEEVCEREDRDRSLFEQANDGIFIMSREGRYVAVNQKFVELTGLRKEEIIGQTTDLLLPGGLTQSLARIEQTIREGTLGPYELEITTPLGTKVFSLNSFAQPGI